MINFKSKTEKIGTWTIVKIPKSESAKLPSRGMVMIKGTINGSSFEAPLEPDGKGSHWLGIDNNLNKKIKSNSVVLKIEPVKEWPEPPIPDDLNKSLSDDKKAHELWIDITPNARWDWIRWINATKNPETRKIRIEKTFSKLKSGKRAACCFNRSQCTQTEVSKNGILLGS